MVWHDGGSHSHIIRVGPHMLIGFLLRFSPSFFLRNKIKERKGGRKKLKSKEFKHTVVLILKYTRIERY